MRDHDTAEREAAAETHGTTDRHGREDRHQAADRPGVTERSEAAERSGSADRSEKTGPFEKTGPSEKAERHEAPGRDVTAGRSPVPAGRGTASSAAEPALPGQDARRPVQPPKPEEAGVRPGPLSGAVGHGDDEHVPDLLNAADGEAYRERWREVQGRFVDDPREAVHSADELVADVMKTLAAAFAEHKQTLEGQWSEGREADTEALRVALREYRSFFNRLLTTSTPQR
ncbi:MULTISPECIES: hypothetical protein [unclassified Streptomyces]|uniref:hypothetical protein n=1 Tax=unclassified Streptomyces TaxID=2593676 RepID=UPI0037F12D64